MRSGGSGGPSTGPPGAGATASRAASSTWLFTVSCPLRLTEGDRVPRRPALYPPGGDHAPRGSGRRSRGAGRGGGERDAAARGRMRPRGAPDRARRAPRVRPRPRRPPRAPRRPPSVRYPRARPSACPLGRRRSGTRASAQPPRAAARLPYVRCRTPVRPPRTGTPRPAHYPRVRPAPCVRRHCRYARCRTSGAARPAARAERCAAGSARPSGRPPYVPRRAPGRDGRAPVPARAPGARPAGTDPVDAPRRGGGMLGACFRSPNSLPRAP